MVSQRILFRAFVGRAAEIEHLLARRRSAADSHGGAVLISGEAGIGKSRLVREYRQRVEHGALFAASGCRAFAQRPMQPIAEVLSLLDARASNPFDYPSASKAEQLAATVEAFDRIARRRTALIVLEDLHWADVELVQTLAILADCAARRRLLFVITYRDNEITPSSAIYSAFGNLIRVPSVSLVQLEPLAVAELTELLNAATADAAPLPPRALFEVRHRCAGNPLFAEELLRHVVDQHRSRTISSHTVPISLQAVIRERLELCTVQDRAFLAAASVLGRRFRLDLLHEIFDFAVDEQLASLRRLRELQLVDPAEGKSLEYGFRHALTRDVVYHEMLPVEVQWLHAKVGTTIAARPDAAEHAEVIAHSFWEAGLRTRAAPYCEMAGEAAVRLYAYEDAAAWYERAAEAFIGCDEDVARVLDKAVRALNWADAATDRALPLCERAVAIHLSSGNLGGAVRLSADMASALNNAGRTAEAVARLKVMLATVPAAAADVALRNRLRIRLAAFYAVLDAADESNRCIEEIDEATLAPDGPVSAEYFFVKSWISAQRFECELWHENFTRCLDTLDRTDASDHFKRAAHESVARQALDLGEIVMARKHALLSLDVARRTKIEDAYYLVLLAEVELRAGNLEPARGLFRDVGPSGEPLTRQGRAIVGTLLALALGDDDLLTQSVDLSMVEEAERSSNPSAMARLASACARGLLQLGRADEAASLLERAVGAIRSPFGIAPEIASMAMLRPEWAVRLRSVVAPDGGIPKHRVNAALCRLIDAILARHSGDEGAARNPASEAARLFGAVGWPLLEAQCWEVAGEQPRALTIYRRTGSLADVRRLERKTFVDRAAATDCAVLTRRERELALLIAAGKDNRSAAEALSISKKAVEKYLTSIYAKLGLSSRAQLAAFVVGGESAERPTVKW